MAQRNCQTAYEMTQEVHSKTIAVTIDGSKGPIQDLNSVGHVGPPVVS